MKRFFLGSILGFLIALNATAWAVPPSQEGLFVMHIAIDPKDSQAIYVTTGFSVGVLKSVDGGKSWTQINEGFKSFSFTQIAVDPADSNQIYLADGCAGLYVSRDKGRSWREMNDGLQNTEIGALVLHPTEAGSAFAITTRGIYKTERAGRRWIAFDQGDTFTQGFDFIGLTALPTRPVTLYAASKQGLYTRKEGDAGWVSAGEPLVGKRISAVAYHAKTGRLYAAIFRRGNLETLREGGLFVSEDDGKSWSRLGEGLEQDRIRMIVFDPVDSKKIYLATSGRGILKSVDEGKHWKEMNVGLTDPDKEIRSLAIDPRDSKILYAGSYGHWIFKSSDGGETWKPLSIGPHQTANQILSALNRDDELVRKESKILPPAAFKKCNTCHGWTDPLINMTPHSLWMVPVNRRDWSVTVKRMSASANLTSDEEKTITDFLQTYSEKKSKSP